MDMGTAFVDAMKADTALAGMITTFRGSAAVFGQSPVPRRARRPYIVTASNLSDVPFDTLDSADGFGRDIRRDVFIYDDHPAGLVRIEQIAERVRAIFHRQRIAPSGWRGVFTTVVSGPLPAPTDDSIIGRVLTVRAVITET